MGCTSSKVEEEPRQNEIKIVMLGNGGVGKSAITFRLVRNEFVQSYNPTIEDSYRKTIEDEDGQIVLDILDTAGQEEYSELREVYMRGGDGFIIVYSITDKRSFEEAREFHDRIIRVKEKRYVPMVLVGNKSDLEAQRIIPKEEAATLAKSWNSPFYETSAQDGTNCIEIFWALTKEVKKGHIKK